MLALAQYPGAPGGGGLVMGIWFLCAVSAMFALWGKKGSFYDVRVWKKVFLTIAIWSLPVVVSFLLAKLSQPD
jgi:hypothetical protein